MENRIVDVGRIDNVVVAAVAAAFVVFSQQNAKAGDRDAMEFGRKLLKEVFAVIWNVHCDRINYFHRWVAVAVVLEVVLFHEPVGLLQKKLMMMTIRRS